jgi:hypothetical protein
MKEKEFTITFPSQELRDRAVMLLAVDYGWQPTIKVRPTEKEPPVVQDNPVTYEEHARNIIAELFKKAIARDDSRAAMVQARKTAEDNARNLEIK